MSARRPPAPLPPPAPPRRVEILSRREDLAWVLAVMLTPAVVVVGAALALVAALMGGAP